MQQLTGAVGGFAVSLVLARFTPLHYVFLTGHHILFMATLLTIVLASADYPPAVVVGRWAEEGAWYDYASNACNAPAGRICGSWLQVVWGATEVVGCGRARCDAGEVWVEGSPTRR